MNFSFKYVIQGIAVFTAFYGLVICMAELILIRTGV